MKASFLSVFLLLAACLAGPQRAAAQQSETLKDHPSVMALATPPVVTPQQIRELSSRLQLTEQQYQTWNGLTRARETRLRQIDEHYKTDAATRQAKISELNAQLEQEFRRILTPAQLSDLYVEPSEPTNDSRFVQPQSQM